MQDTRNQQVPWESSSLIGDFYFAQRALIAPPVAIQSPTPAPGSSQTIAPVVTPAPAPAPAPGGEEPQSQYLATHRDWNTFQFMEDSHRVCYTASRPTKEEPSNLRRGDVFFLVTHRPAENSRDVVSIVTGYTYKPGSEVTLQIGNDSFRLFTENDTAWVPTAATDRVIVQAMTNGSSMMVRGTTMRGNNTTDTYSLRGFSAAYNQINEVCGVR